MPQLPTQRSRKRSSLDTLKYTLDLTSSNHKTYRRCSVDMLSLEHVQELPTKYRLVHKLDKVQIQLIQYETTEKRNQTDVADNDIQPISIQESPVTPHTSSKFNMKPRKNSCLTPPNTNSLISASTTEIIITPPPPNDSVSSYPSEFNADVHLLSPGKKSKRNSIVKSIQCLAVKTINSIRVKLKTESKLKPESKNKLTTENSETQFHHKKQRRARGDIK